VTRYDDLLGRTELARLKPCSTEEITAIAKRHPSIPDEYTDFLAEIGTGDIGPGTFMLYSGLVEPKELLGSALEGPRVLAFGDDFKGYVFGFELDDGWAVVEIDPDTRTTDRVSLTFEEYVRNELLSSGQS
jgi:hypothetical protein